MPKQAIQAMYDGKVLLRTDYCFDLLSQTMVDTQKNNNPQCGNTGERILSNEPHKHWLQHMSSGLAYLKTICFKN